MSPFLSFIALALPALVAVATSPAPGAIVVDSSNTPWIQGAGDVVNDTGMEISNDATAEIRAGASVTLSGSLIVGQRTWSGRLSQLIASGGDLTTGWMNVCNKAMGDAYLKFSGATVQTGGMTIASAVAGKGGDSIDMLHSAGSVTVTGNGELRIGSSYAAPTSTPVIQWTQTGGDFSYAGKWMQIGLLADNTATYTISGGTFLQSKSHGDFWGLQVGGSAGEGTGTFHVDGWWDVPGVDKEIDLRGGGTRVGEQGTLKFSIHDANGTTLINVTDVDAANMLGTVDMDLVGYTPAMGETFDLITGAANYGSLTLAGDDADAWSLCTSGETLQATYLVPDPASLMLLALGAALMKRRGGSAA
ncbi:MAG: hypothetical protein ACOC7R_00555 [Planctomycetota bacterium]